MSLENAEERLFQAMKKLADTYGWELSKRDPGPEQHPNAYVTLNGDGKTWELRDMHSGILIATFDSAAGAIEYAKTLDTEVDTYSDVWPQNHPAFNHRVACGCLWSDDLDLLEICPEHRSTPPDPKAGWTEAEIRRSTREIRSL